MPGTLLTYVTKQVQIVKNGCSLLLAPALQNNVQLFLPAFLLLLQQVLNVSILETHPAVPLKVITAFGVLVLLAKPTICIFDPLHLLSIMMG